MLKHLASLTVALLLVLSVTGYACNGEKTADASKASSETYTCPYTGKTVTKTASADKDADAVMQKTDANADKACSASKTWSKSADACVRKTDAEAKSASYDKSACNASKDANVSSVSVKNTEAGKDACCPYMAKVKAAKSDKDCASKCTDSDKVKNSASKSSEDNDKTVMTDKKETSEKL